MKLDSLRKNYDSRRRFNRPKKITKRIDRQLIQSAVKSGPNGRRQPLFELNLNITLGISKKTIKRRL